MRPQSLLRATLLCLATLLTMPAFGGNDTRASTPQDSAIQVTDQDVENFADAHRQVMEVRREYIGKAKQIEDKEKMAQLKLAMQKDMLAAVKDSGMKPQRYNQVARQVAQDEQLRKRVEKALEE